MKKLLLMLVFTVSATAAPVEVKKPVICENTETLVKLLSSENYQEKPIWLGASDEKMNTYSLWINASTKNWTIIQFNNEIACILGTGENYTILTRKPSI
jgi:hypothetical protein